MSLITPYLKAALEKNASDIHIKPNQAPVFRVSRTLETSSFPVLTAEDIRIIVLEMLPDHLKNDKKTIGMEMDFSYQEEGVGRYRVNVFMSQNAPAIAMRHVKSEVPSFEDINVPSILYE
ncbi:MAG: twitching motility protein, partial [Lentisphaerae bacterium]|nr:twitching motility protein [Lentisphaerota bacterium]